MEVSQSMRVPSGSVSIGVVRRHYCYLRSELRGMCPAQKFGTDAVRFCVAYGVGLPDALVLGWIPRM